MQQRERPAALLGIMGDDLVDAGQGFGLEIHSVWKVAGSEERVARSCAEVAVFRESGIGKVILTTRCSLLQKLAVALAHDEVEGAEDGYHVGDELVLTNVRQDGEITE
ncbi:MAG: hypothetical protein SynsKO_08590 [Synoicihabitans sp.]